MELDLERVEEEEEERSMRGQDVEIWRRELPPGHCLGRGQLFYNDLSQVDRGQSFQKRK